MLDGVAVYRVQHVAQTEETQVIVRMLSIVDVLQIRRFSAQTRAVVNYLTVDLFGAVINERHNLPASPRYLNKLSISASVTSASGDFAAPA